MYEETLMSMKDTQKLFDKHERFVRTSLSLNLAEYNKVKKITLDNMGPYDKDKTYCGPGWLGDKLVPDLCFKFAGYVHDGLYAYLEIADNDVMSKDMADKVFKAIMLSTCDKCPVSGIFVCDDVLPNVYFKAVDIFGNPE